MVAKARKRDTRIDYSSLYRMPWSKNDNPNGWVEITTYCNLSCPGCYRGCDRKDNDPEHKSLEKIRKEIVEIIRIRNCDTIALSGGEPLMHPKILEILDFISNQGVYSTIYTNGRILDKKLLLKLRKAGLDGLIIGLDSLKEPEKKSSEKELNRRREELAGLVYDVGDIQLKFIAGVNSSNFDQVPDIIRWVRKDARVDGLILIPIKEVVFDPREKKKDDSIDYFDLYDSVKASFPDLRFSAFLGSSKENLKAKWLFSFWFEIDGEILGYFDSRAMEIAQVFYHMKNGRYPYLTNKEDHYLPLRYLVFFSIMNRGTRKILYRYISKVLRNPLNLFRSIHLKIMIMLNAPGFVDGERDLCDSCPDATLHEGVLVSSCIMEEVKRYGKPYYRGDKSGSAGSD